MATGMNAKSSDKILNQWDTLGLPLRTGVILIGTVTCASGDANIGNVDVVTMPVVTVTGGSSAQNIGDVDVLTMPVVTVTAGSSDKSIGTVGLDAGSNVIGMVTGGSSARSIGSVGLDAGTNVVGQVTGASSNANIGNVDVLTMPVVTVTGGSSALQIGSVDIRTIAGASLSATEDAAALTRGLQAMGRYDSTTPTAVDDGDATLLLTDEYGRTRVWLDSKLDSVNDAINVETIAGATPTIVGGELYVVLAGATVADGKYIGDIKFGEALAAGTNVIGQVTGASSDANIGNVDVLTMPVVTVTGGSSNVNIGDVDVLTMPVVTVTGGSSNETIGKLGSPSDATYIGDIKFGEAIVAGNAVIGQVTGASSDANIGNVDVLTMPVVTVTAGSSDKSIGTVGLDAGSNVIGMVTGGSSAQNIGDVDVLTMPVVTVTGGSSNETIGKLGSPSDATYIGDIKFGEALVAGNAVIGQVTGASSDANIGNVDVVTMPVVTVTAGSSNEAIGKLAANDGVDIGDVDIASIGALELTAATLFHVSGASGSVEYSQALPDNCRRLSVQCQQDAITRYAWVTGKVASPTAPYWTLKASDIYLNDQIKLTSKTIYLGAATHSLTYEIEAWT